MSTLDTLNKVLGKIQQNRENIVKQLAASTAALGAPTSEVEDAIELLIKTYGPNPQVIGQTIGAKLQIAQLDEALVEVDTMIASLQVGLSDDVHIAATADLITRGATDSNPLSDAAGDGQSHAADEKAPSEVAPAPAEAPVEGAADASAPVDGAVA